MASSRLHVNRESPLKNKYIFSPSQAPRDFFEKCIFGETLLTLFDEKNVECGSLSVWTTIEEERKGEISKLFFPSRRWHILLEGNTRPYLGLHDGGEMAEL